MIVSSRRGFLTGLGASLLAAPAIVRAGSLMPVKAIAELDIRAQCALLNRRLNEAYLITRKAMDKNLYEATFGLPSRYGMSNIIIGAADWDFGVDDSNIWTSYRAASA